MPADPALDAPRLVPLAAIDAKALIRDRMAVCPEAMAELRSSILVNGLRQPIELCPLDEPLDPAHRFGLVSGWRRLTIFRDLHAETGLEHFAAIPAVVRAPADYAAALLAMVEENEIRAGISAWERGRIAVKARDNGVFPSLDEAVDRLYPTANRQKRLRLRQLATLVDELDGCLHAPERLSQRNALRLAEACQRGHADLIRATLKSLPRAEREAQWATLGPLLAELEAAPVAPGPRGPGRPRRHAEPRPGLVIRREKTRAGLALHFTGRLATDDILDAVFYEIERLFAPE